MRNLAYNADIATIQHRLYWVNALSRYKYCRFNKFCYCKHLV